MNCCPVLTEGVVASVAVGLARLLPSDEAEAVRGAGTPLPGARSLEVTARGRCVGIRIGWLQHEHN